MARPTASGIHNFQNIMNLFFAGLGTDGLFAEPIRGLPEASGQLNFNINNLSNMFGPVLSQALNLRNTFRQSRPDIPGNLLTSQDPYVAGNAVRNLSGSFQPAVRAMDSLASTVAQRDPGIHWRSGGLERTVTQNLDGNVGLAGNEVSKMFGFATKLVGMVQNFSNNKRNSSGPDQHYASSDFDKWA